MWLSFISSFSVVELMPPLGCLRLVRPILTETGIGSLLAEVVALRVRWSAALVCFVRTNLGLSVAYLLLMVAGSSSRLERKGAEALSGSVISREDLSQAPRYSPGPAGPVCEGGMMSPICALVL
jgi:hypothetical protein